MLSVTVTTMIIKSSYSYPNKLVQIYKCSFTGSKNRIEDFLLRQVIRFSSSYLCLYGENKHGKLIIAHFFNSIRKRVKNKNTKTMK